jgi:GMP synthase-like glutamine amidotransferase
MSLVTEASVLVIQGRTNKKVLQEERAKFEAIAQTVGVKLRFVNPLNPSWLLANLYMRDAVGTIWAGSSDVNFSEVTKNATRYKTRARKLAQRILRDNLPTLAICLGHQYLNMVAGGTVEAGPKVEGVQQVKLKNGERSHAPFQDTDKPLTMFFSHQDYVIQPGEGFEVIGVTQGDPNCVLRRGNITTIQAHPELTRARGSKVRSSDNRNIVANFLTFAKEATQE